MIKKGILIFAIMAIMLCVPLPVSAVSAYQYPNISVSDPLPATGISYAQADDLCMQLWGLHRHPNADAIHHNSYFGVYANGSPGAFTDDLHYYLPPSVVDNSSTQSTITDPRANVTQSQIVCSDVSKIVKGTIFFKSALYVATDPSSFNFTGYPVDGHAPLTVSFTIQNFSYTNGSSSWSFGDGNITTSSLTALTHVYQNPGTYTVRLDYYNNSGIAGYVQKNNYITVGAPNATKTKWFQTIDGTNGNIVLNSSIQLKDVENSSWVNATGLIDDGMSSITTLEGHTINAYAQALGYSDADDLGILNDGQPEYIMMWPTFAKNVSAGNVSVYITVKDKDTKANIVGAQVIVSTAGNSVSTTTNEAGIAYVIVTNNTIALITAQAIGQGYQTATTTINTGTASGGSASAAATILLGKNTVTPTFTTSVTTLPGGGTPTPIITILPGCEDQISAAGQEKCRAAQSNQSLSWLSGNLFGLVQICFVVTILYLLGIKLGK